MKRQRNTQQVKEQDKCPPNQTKEEEIGNLPEKEFRKMRVKMIGVEMIRRLRMGWSAFGSIVSCILPVLTYGAETWRLTKRIQTKLRTTERAMERKMIGVTLRDKKRAEWIREQTRVKDILVEIKKKKWTWAGHVMRRQDNRWSLRVTEWIPRGRR